MSGTKTRPRVDLTDPDSILERINAISADLLGLRAEARKWLRPDLVAQIKRLEEEQERLWEARRFAQARRQAVRPW